MKILKLDITSNGRESSFVSWKQLTVDVSMREAEYVSFAPHNTRVYLSGATAERNRRPCV